MKTLLIMRHAKSDWSDPNLSDFDRPLNRRGQQDLPRLARLLATFAAPPDCILASPALRARQTAEHLAAKLGAENHLHFDPDLYLASPHQLAHAITHLPATTQSALIVAHNPGLEDWLEALCGARVHLPTGALAALALELDDWASVEAAHLLWLVIPRLLKALEID